MPIATPPPPQQDPLIGATLGGHYRITSLLGRGGMSRVYQAVQAPLGRAVALKVLKDDPSDPSLQKRFLLEASTTSQLTHPNTITIFDYGADRGLLFFAMELLRGCNLSQALKREGRFSEARTLHIARQICRSLREAHVRGMVHRDLKPSNFFLTEHGDESDFVKVLDFGLVKMFGADDHSPHLTSGGLVLGTPHYMAPEQARGLNCDQRSDVYSLGVVLFQMLSGHVPYDGASTVDVLLRHVSDPVPRLREAYPDVQVSVDLEAVVMRCMAKNPEDRFRNMEELLSALPGDRPQRTRPPPLPLDADTEEMEAQPSIRSTTGKLGKRGDTHEIPGARAQGQISSPRQQPVAPPPAPAPRGRGVSLVLAGAGAALVLGGAAAWMLRAKPRAPEAPASAPVAAATPVPPVVVVAKADPPPPPEPAAPATPPPAPEVVAAPEPPAPEVHKAPAKRERPAAAKRAKVVHETTAPGVIEEIKERLGRAVPGIRQCAMLESRHGREVAGELQLAVSLEPSGRIAAIDLSGLPLGKSLESCIRGAVQRVSFEAYEGAPVRLKRAVALSPR